MTSEANPFRATVFALALALLVDCGSRVAITNLAGNTMGTTYRLTYPSTGGSEQEEARAIDDLLHSINLSLSTYLPDSTISRLNASDDIAAWHPVDAHFETVFLRAHSIYEDTSGAFNPAVGPLVNAWGFGPGRVEAPPDDATIARLLRSVSFDAFEIRSSPPGVRKRIADGQLDFSAIAKGYAVDAIAHLLEGQGVTSYFVEIGGEVRTRGQHPAGRAWRVGIEKPSLSADSPREVQTVLLQWDAALATSGNYRNYRIRDGKRIAHILSPATGRPEESSVLSVSVLAEDTMTADGYATAFMVMGVEKALRLVESRPGLEAYFLVSDGAGGVTEKWSSGFPRGNAP